MKTTPDEKTPDPVDVEVGRRICARRLQLRKSQSDLARAIGLTFQQVQKYETGANRVSCSKLVAIARALETEASTFLPATSDQLQAAEIPSLATRAGFDLVRIYEGLDDERRRFLLTMARGLNGLPVAA